MLNQLQELDTNQKIENITINEIVELFSNETVREIKTKTEDLMYLMYRITEHDKNIEIINEVNLQGDNLTIKIKQKF